MPKQRYAKRKLTAEDAANIKAALRSGRDRGSIAQDYGVSRGTIDAIATGRIWSCVPGGTEPAYVDASLPGEVWKPVVGHERSYSVSSLGRVRREQRRGSRAAGSILHAYPNPDGYPTVGLRVGNKQVQRRVHTLVAAAFIGPCPDGHEVNHKNADKNDNRPEMLEYTTHLENLRHSQRLGLRKKRGGVKGQFNAAAILTDGDVIEIRARIAAGDRLQGIADDYGVCRVTISDIKSGRNWGHLQPSAQSPGQAAGQPTVSIQRSVQTPAGSAATHCGS